MCGSGFYSCVSRDSSLLMDDSDVLCGLVQCGKRKLSRLTRDESERLLRRTLLRQSLKTWRRQQKEIRRHRRFERRDWRSFYRAWEEEDDFEDCEELHEIRVHNPELAAAFAALDNAGGCVKKCCDSEEDDDGTVDSFYHCDQTVDLVWCDLVVRPGLIWFGLVGLELALGPRESSGCEEAGEASMMEPGGGGRWCAVFSGRLEEDAIVWRRRGGCANADNDKVDDRVGVFAIARNRCASALFIAECLPWEAIEALSECRLRVDLAALPSCAGAKIMSLPGFADETLPCILRGCSDVAVWVLCLKAWRRFPLESCVTRQQYSLGGDFILLRCVLLWEIGCEFLMEGCVKRLVETGNSGERRLISSFLFVWAGTEIPVSKVLKPASTSPPGTICPAGAGLTLEGGRLWLPCGLDGGGHRVVQSF
ncbi:unnamed protein product [Taenia asiatica]|uniref:Uncharacterized protein n=1 Tax=Taenia asiatica TaxID=60517 RepID=A0A0R3VXH3_TAEAS|nr:unnamed protein product [Taenia asiatica]